MAECEGRDRTADDSTQTSVGHGATVDATEKSNVLDQSIPPLSAAWRPEPLSPDELRKVHKILQACKDRDLEALRMHATSPGGLVEDEVRRLACMSYENPLRDAMC